MMMDAYARGVVDTGVRRPTCGGGGSCGACAGAAAGPAGASAPVVGAVGGAPRPNRTLDLEHTSELHRMQGVQRHVSLVRDELTAVRARAAELDARDRRALTDAEYDELKACAVRESRLQRELSAASDTSDVVDYYLRTGRILLHYYDLVDKGLGAAAAAAAAPPKSAPAKPTSILAYFAPASQQAPSKCAEAAEVEKHPGKACAGGGGVTNDQRATLLDKYVSAVSAPWGSATAMAAADPATVAVAVASAADAAAQQQQQPPTSTDRAWDVCPFCDSDASRTLVLHDGYVYCPACHSLEYVIVDHDKPAYKEPPKEIAFFAYKRINHFNEWLNQVQGKETTDIPDDVFDNILLEIKKQKVTNMAALTPLKIKSILKKLRLAKYYEHGPHILNKLNGLPSPHLPPELEDRLRQMFCQIQVPFLKHAPPARRNFLSYAFVLHKMVQLLGHDEYLCNFPLLRSREKLNAQDTIWRKICQEVGWDFIPSL